MSQRPGNPVAELAGAIRQAKPVVALLGTDAAAVSAAVDSFVSLLSGDPIRVVRVRGLLGAPLTLSRIVEEIGAEHGGGPRADDDELIVRVLATRAGGEHQVVLLLERAELLASPTLAFLQVALTVFGARTPRLQLLFAGHPRFLSLIDRDELTPLRDRLDPVVRVRTPLAGPESSAMPGRVDLGDAAKTRRSVAGPGRRRLVFAALPALLLAAAAATIGRNWYGGMYPFLQAAPPVPSAQSDPLPAQSPPSNAQPSSEPALSPQAAEPETAPVPPNPEPDVAGVLPSPPPVREPDVAAAPLPPIPEVDAAAAPAPPQLPPPRREPDVAAPPTPERHALRSSGQVARLRGEFDRFLSQTEWGSKKLSENEKSRLFNEYVRWNYGTLAATPGATP